LATVFLGVCPLVGCSSNPHFTTPSIQRALADGGFERPHEKLRAYSSWSTGYGHGLVVEIWVKQDASKYRRDFEQELEGVTAVAEALAWRPEIADWDFLEIQYFMDHGTMPQRGRRVIGMLDGWIKQEAMLRYRQQRAGGDPRFEEWEVLDGYKDQPDSKQMLRWECRGREEVIRALARRPLR